MKIIINLLVAAVPLFLLILVPISSLAATSQESEFGLQPGKIHTLGVNKNKVNLQLFVPLGWELTRVDSTAGGINYTKSFPGLSVNGSIDIDTLDFSSNIDPALRNKKPATIVKNYFAATTLKSLAVENLKQGKVSIDGVTGNYIDYTFNGSHYLNIIYTKSNKIYLINAQTPTTQWSKNKASIEQSLASLTTRKPGLSYSK